MTNHLELSVTAVKELLHAGAAVRVIDVREPEEFEICQIAGSRLIPMGSIPLHLTALEDEAEEAKLVFLCHHGIRSLNVVAWLHEKGVTNCVSMAGGIDAWSLQVDSSVPRY